jgi:hypothetical protein
VSNKKFNNWTPLLFISIFQISENKQKKRGYPRWVRGWKNILKGLFKHARLGQVRNVIKSLKSQAMWSPIHLLACFGQKFKRSFWVFERTTLSRYFCICSKFWWFVPITVIHQKCSMSHQQNIYEIFDKSRCDDLTHNITDITVAE